MKRMIRLRVVIPLVAAGVLGLFAVVGALSQDADRETDAASVAERQTVGEQWSPDATQSTDAGASLKSASGDAAVQDVAADVPPASAPSTHYLVRTGDLSLLVKRGTLLSAADRVKAMTTAMGGYVMASAVGSDGGVAVAEPQISDTPAGVSRDTATTSSSVAATPYATLTVRVPEQMFDTAMKRLATLGDVQRASTSSEDVTSQYVDLQARLQHYRAVDRRLLTFLSRADTIGETLKVQDRIDAVQLTIEQLSAQLKSLRETTAYGTVSIFISEKGVPQAGSIDPSDTFTGTFWNSVKLLGHGARVTGLVATALLPFVVVFSGIGLVVWYMIRRVRRSRRQPPQPV